MDYIESMKEFDMELASDFLVMGATLVSIKSRMMLPGMQAALGSGEMLPGMQAALGSGEDVVDPREELVISLMRYKRCRIFASDLKERRDKFDGARFREETNSTVQDSAMLQLQNHWALPLHLPNRLSPLRNSMKPLR